MAARDEEYRAFLLAMGLVKTGSEPTIPGNRIDDEGPFKVRLVRLDLLSHGFLAGLESFLVSLCPFKRHSSAEEFRQRS